MLSEYERRELALIEQGLVEEDRGLAESFRSRSVPARTERRFSVRSRWLARALLGFGVFLLAVGLFAGADGLFMQGVLFSGAAVVWMRWLRRVSAKADEGSTPQRRAEGPTPGSRPA